MELQLCDYIIIGFVNDHQNAIYANINTDTSECINDIFYYITSNDSSRVYLLLHQYAQLKIKKLDLMWIKGVYIKDKKENIIYNTNNQLTNLYNECNKYGIQLLINGQLVDTY